MTALCHIHSQLQHQHWSNNLDEDLGLPSLSSFLSYHLPLSFFHTFQWVLLAYGTCVSSSLCSPCTTSPLTVH